MPEPPPNSFHAHSRDEWRAWLESEHARSEGVWLISYKKAAAKPTLTYDEAVEEALCFGWIDSKPNALDEERTMLWFAPRKAGSGWSRINKQRIARLTEAGRMAPAGLERIAAAQADGSWSALDEVEDLVIPDDLAAALAANPPAEQNFAAFPRSAKRGILEWIAAARKPETRARRIGETAALAAENKRANQWRK